MLTTQTGRDITQNVVTDLNANVSSPDALASKRVISREAANLFNKSLVARPLAVPEPCSIHVKNTEYQYRWVNNDSLKGRIYTQRRHQGFINATTDDVEVLGGDAHSDNSAITAGDLILMKIRADLYDAAIKYNAEKALIMQRARGMYMQGGSPDVQSDAVAQRVSVAQEPWSKTGKAQNFIPEDPDALVSASILRGDDVAAREQTNEIRENIKASPAKEE